MVIAILMVSHSLCDAQTVRRCAPRRIGIFPDASLDGESERLRGSLGYRRTGGRDLRVDRALTLAAMIEVRGGSKSQAARRRLVCGVLLALLVWLMPACSTVPAQANRDQAATGSRVPDNPGQEAATATGPRLRLLGHTNLGARGERAQVAALGRYAYVGSTNFTVECPGLGVAIVDLVDPTAPTEVATAARIPGTTAEHVVAIRVQTQFFSGDLLGVGIQRCGEHGSDNGAGGSTRQAGLLLVDVTNPRQPRDLGFFSVGSGSGEVHGVHELDLVRRADGRVLALLAVPGSDEQDGGDFQIVDVTNPRRPVHLSSWSARNYIGQRDSAEAGGAASSCLPSVLGHSTSAGAGGRRAYVSYWDAGVFLLDIEDPTSPRVISRIRDPEADGASHSVDEAPGSILLATEEIGLVFGPRRLTFRAAGGGQTLDLVGCEAPSRTPLRASGTLTGPLALAGRACAPLSAPLPGAIVLVESGGCGVTEKGRQLADAQAAAMLVSQPRGPVLPHAGPAAALPLPAIGISQSAADRLQLLARTGPVGLTLPVTREWGGLRIWDVSTPARPKRLAVFHTDNSARFPPQDGGWYTAHHPLAVNSRYALVSWYSDGIRLVDIRNPSQPREVAAFRPPSRATDTLRDSADTPAMRLRGMIWGVARTGDLVLASDIGGGLYVLRLEGIPLPAP